MVLDTSVTCSKHPLFPPTWPLPNKAQAQQVCAVWRACRLDGLLPACDGFTSVASEECAR